MTAHRPDFVLPVDAVGALRLDTPDGSRIDVKADGPRLHVDVPAWKDLERIGPRSLLARRRAVVRAARILETLGLRIEVDVARQYALGLGTGTRPTLVARLLRLGRVHVPVSSLIALLRRP